MSFLTRLFGAKKSVAGANAPTIKSLIKARGRPWHKVAPIVIDAIFEALDDTELFDCFVLASMERKLIVRYEALGSEGDNTEIIRAQISQILCQSGFLEIESLKKALSRNEIDNAKKIGFLASNLFEPSIGFSPNQIGGYIGMATLYGLFGNVEKCQEYAKGGLLVLETWKESGAARAMRKSTFFPPDFLAQAEQQLRGYLEISPEPSETVASAPPSHAQDDTSRIGRRGICMLCGTIKSGSFVQCEECGFEPISDKELAISLMLNETSARNFIKIADAIKAGGLAEFKDEDIQRFLGAAKEVSRMLGRQQPRYYTRAKTEELLKLSMDIATIAMPNSISSLESSVGKIQSSVFKKVSKERFLAIFCIMLKKELLKLAPDAEREFIDRIFEKRLVHMSMKSSLPALAGMERDEFALRVAQSIRYFDTKKLNVAGDAFALENSIVPFVLPIDAIHSYREQFSRNPYIGIFLHSLLVSSTKSLSEHAKGWR